jgi:hypothetical protein
MGMKGCSLYKAVFRIIESRGTWTRYVACIAKRGIKILDRKSGKSNQRDKSTAHVSV